MSKPSYVIGSSYSLNTLTEAERAVLDSAPWVFTCNSFLSHWESAGFRPTVWCYGDNHHKALIQELSVELHALSESAALQERLVWPLVCLEDFATQAVQAVRDLGIPAQFYRRGSPWARIQQPACELNETIYHYGSTLTNLVNFARILNPGGEIRLFGNEWGPGYGHFYEGKITHRYPKIWPRVKQAMWEGLSDLHHKWYYPLVDCNRHEEPLPEELRLPTGSLCGFPQHSS